MQRGQLTTTSITERAYTLAHESGLDHLTYNGLARDIGIRPQSLYRYLPNITAVKTAVVTLATTRLTTHLQNAVSGRQGLDAVRTFASAYVEFNQSGISLTEMINAMGTLRTNPELNAALRALNELTERVVAGATRDPDLIPANSQLLVELLTGHLAQLAAGNPAATNDDQTLQNFERIITLF
ncbi:hypothetical protein [Lacticaseibacillus pantheris]|uniref:hypothetical protein n=1 Tax=Lacticaseibacillus pantheris TaxID=171523 RepID=UPI00265ABA74|nr:hypothetical protein [Lacticaseibacillus pantheris]WKF85697.1 hypothetical protein QY874_03680 [Lacticaseibacillus pantheris]